MRAITIPAVDWDDVAGMYVVIPVKVDWPELRLTQDQILTNAVAAANGESEPYPDHSFFSVQIERPRVDSSA